MNRRTLFAAIPGGLSLPFMRKARPEAVAMKVGPTHTIDSPKVAGEFRLEHSEWKQVEDLSASFYKPAWGPCEYCGRHFPLHELVLLHVRITDVKYRDVRGCRDCVICNVSGVTDAMRGVPK